MNQSCFFLLVVIHTEVVEEQDELKINCTTQTLHPLWHSYQYFYSIMPHFH